MIIDYEDFLSSVEHKGSYSLGPYNDSQSNVVLDPTDFHCMNKNSGNILQNTVSTFVFHRRKKVIQVWNNMTK